MKYRLIEIYEAPNEGVEITPLDGEPEEMIHFSKFSQVRSTEKFLAPSGDVVWVERNSTNGPAVRYSDGKVLNQIIVAIKEESPK